MKKDDLVHENEKLRRENEILKLKLEQEEVYNSIQRYRLEADLEKYKRHADRGDGTHLIGFDIASTQESYYGDEESIPVHII